MRAGKTPKLRQCLTTSRKEVSCGSAAAALRSALAGAGAEDVEGLLELGVEMRAALPVHGVLIDSIVCAARGADSETFPFLNGLAVTGSAEVLRQLGLASAAGLDGAAGPAAHPR